MSSPRGPALLAAVLAMIGSTMAMAAVVVSDLEDDAAEVEVLGDDPSVPTPVSIRKLTITPEAEPEPKFDEVFPGVKLKFGRFEGY